MALVRANRCPPETNDPKENMEAMEAGHGKERRTVQPCLRRETVTACPALVKDQLVVLVYLDPEEECSQCGCG